MKQRSLPNNRIHQLFYDTPGSTKASQSPTSTMSRPQPSLLPCAKDDDFPIIKRNKCRQKKAVDKWNLLWFIPSNVLNNREFGAGLKQGKREGFNTYNRLACKVCRHAFHKSAGFRLHHCTGLSSFSARGTSNGSYITSTFLSNKKSSKASNPNFTMEEDDEIEIVGDTEQDKKNEERIDKNFSKMSLANQRRAIEEYRASSLFVEEEEEPTAAKVSEKRRRNVKKKAILKEVYNDFEVIDIEEDDSSSSSQASKTKSEPLTSKVSNKEDDSDDEIEVLLMKVLDETSENNILDVLEELEATITKMPLNNEVKLLGDDHDNSQNTNFIKVKWASEKSMRAEIHKYDEVQKDISLNVTDFVPMSNKSETESPNKSKKVGWAKDVEVVELDDSLEYNPPSKRKQARSQEPTCSSKRFRSRG